MPESHNGTDFDNESKYRTPHVSGFFRVSIVIIFFLGILATSMLILTNRLREDQYNDAERMEVLLSAKVHIAEFHLWLEEYIIEDNHIDIGMVMDHLEYAKREIGIIVDGGLRINGERLAPTDEPLLEGKQVTLLSALNELTDISNQRIANPEESGVGTPIDFLFDKTFHEALQVSNEMIFLLEEHSIHHLILYRRLFIGIIIVWAAALVVGFIFFYLMERRRSLLAEARDLAVEELRESEKRTALAQSVGKVGIWDWDPNSGKLLWSDEVYILFGLTPGEIEPTYEFFLERVHPNDREFVSASVEAALKEMKPFKLDCRIMGTDGTKRIAEATGEVQFDEDGKPLRMLGTFMDITERKRAEEELRESTFLLEESQRVARLGTYLFNAKDGSWKSSLILDDIFGLDEAYKKDVDGWLEIIHPDDRDELAGYLSEDVITKRGSFDREYRIVRINDSEERWVHGLGELEIDSDGEVLYMIGTIQDITERKRAEEELRLTQFALEHAPDAVYWMDPDGRFLYVNESACSSLGYSRGELLSMGVEDVDPNLPDGIPLEMAQATRETGVARIESEHRTKDGRVFPVEVVVGYMEFEGSEYHCSFVRDITERKQAVEALKESELNYKRAQEITHLGHWSFDPETRVVEGSDELFKIFNMEPGKLTLETFVELMHPDDREDVTFAIQKSIESGEPYDITYRLSLDGENLKWVHALGEPIPDETGKVTQFVGTLLDVTEHKLNEERIKSAVKEKEILLREIHHRVKNNLQVISGLLQIQSRALKKNPKLSVEEVLQDSQNRIKSMGVIHDLLHHSGDLAGVDLTQGINMIGKDLIRTFDMEDRVGFTSGDLPVKIGIDQAIPCALIINELIMNSLKHGFPGDREGSIEVIFTEDASGMVELIISDDGVGLDKKINWKAPSSVGLDLVKGLVSQINGVVNVESSSHSGTRFIIKFRRV